SNVNNQSPVDMFSTCDKIVIEVELAGVRMEDIEVTILHNTLTIRGIKYECFDEERINFVCMERNFGNFCRNIELPYPVDATRTEATYKDGLLTIVLPRVEERRITPRRIPIEA
ncbi:MAG: Hsp20/alpha crystallin family protein, partial [Deltaproteobacteria bacterium]|nr:Hsp20/alpha crystallin family protein [Deltaproteobacteria bacterium]